MKPATTPSAGNGKSSFSMLNTRYAQARQNLMKLQTKLFAVGAQAEIDIPSVVAIGNQSAGKSSVVEAISGIKVPRDSGTCTRSPFEIRLSSSNRPWTCRVSIRWEYGLDGRRKQDVKEQKIGDPITNPDDVEHRLRVAAAAVLQPWVEPQQFLTIPANQLRRPVMPDTTVLSFSHNVVCVQIEGPDLVDLSFIDLPGLVQVAEHPALVKLVEDLVVERIKGNSLILVTIPMTDDIDNQKALTLARQADPAGERTICVLTKPDVVSKGSKSRGIWFDVLEGRANPLCHGYYCTRQPDDDEREGGMTPEQARKAEVAYFSKTEPWCSSTQKHRFGIQNLVDMLSPLLEKAIRDSLPAISEKARKHLLQCEEELARLPQAISNPVTYTFNLLAELSHDIYAHVKGGPGSEALVQQNKAVFLKFRDSLLVTVPEFRPFVKVNGPANRFDNFLEETQDEDDDRPRNFLVCSVYLDDMKEQLEKSITRELPDNVPFSAKVTLIKRFQERWPAVAEECSKAIREITTRFVLGCIEAKFGRWPSLHGQIRDWVTELIAKRFAICQQHIEGALMCERDPYTYGERLYSLLTARWLAKYRDARVREVPNLVRFGPRAPPPPPVSNNFPFTAPPNFFSQGSKSNASQARASPRPAQPRTPAPPPAPAQAPGPAPMHSPLPDESQTVQSTLEMLARLGYAGLTADDLGKLRKADEYETEMRVMAEVRSYFDIAYRRHRDVIPAIIDNLFVKPIARELHEFLMDKMAPGLPDAPERFSRYLAEDPAVAHQRDNLNARRKTLEIMKKELIDFGM